MIIFQLLGSLIILLIRRGPGERDILRQNPFNDVLANEFTAIIQIKTCYRERERIP